MNTENPGSPLVARFFQGAAVASALTLGAGYIWWAQNKGEIRLTKPGDTPTAGMTRHAHSEATVDSHVHVTDSTLGHPPLTSEFEFINADSSDGLGGPLYSAGDLISGSKSLQVPAPQDGLKIQEIKPDALAGSSKGGSVVLPQDVAQPFKPGNLISGSKFAPIEIAPGPDAWRPTATPTPAAPHPTVDPSPIVHQPIVDPNVLSFSSKSAVLLSPEDVESVIAVPGITDHPAPVQEPEILPAPQSVSPGDLAGSSKSDELVTPEMLKKWRERAEKERREDDARQKLLRKQRQ